MSSVGLGFGTTAQLELTPRLYFQGTALVGAIGFGAAGSLGLDPELERDCHIGPGAQGVLEARLILRKLGALGVRARNWLVAGGYVPQEGFESITYVRADLQVRVAPGLALGVEIPLGARVYTFGLGTQSVGSTALRMTLTFRSDDELGIGGPLP